MPQGPTIESDLIDRIQRATTGRVALIGLPFDVRSSYLRGASEAPSLIREALYSDAGNLSSECGFDLGGGSPILDLGDLDASVGPDPEPAIRESIETDPCRHAGRHGAASPGGRPPTGGSIR